jgi:hypothetical protein
MTAMRSACVLLLGFFDVALKSKATMVMTRSSIAANTCHGIAES